MTEARVQELMRVVKAALRPLLYAEGRRHPQADEMLSGAYLAAWQQAERMRPDCRYAWTTIVSKAARWGALAEIRCRRCNVPPLVSLEDEGHPVTDGGIAAAEARLLLARAGVALTEKQACALRLLFWEGLTLSEAARAMGVTHTTVMGHRDDALRKYRRALEGR